MESAYLLSRCDSGVPKTTHTVVAPLLGRCRNRDDGAIAAAHVDHTGRTGVLALGDRILQPQPVLRLVAVASLGGLELGGVDLLLEGCGLLVALEVLGLLVGVVQGQHLEEHVAAGEFTLAGLLRVGPAAVADATEDVLLRPDLRADGLGEAVGRLLGHLDPLLAVLVAPDRVVVRAHGVLD